MVKRLCSCLLLTLLCSSPGLAETLSLAQSLVLARNHNKSLMVAETSRKLADEQVKEARGAQLPRVDLTAGYTLQAAPQEVLIGGLSEPTQDRNFAHASLSAEQLLYDFGQTSARVNAARAAAAAGSEDLAALQQQVALLTIDAYYGILAAGQLQNAAREEVELVNEHLREAQALYDNGVVTRNDVLQAEVRLASANQQLLSRTSQLENAWLAFNELTGRPADARAELSPETDLLLPLDAESVVTRPELLAQQQRLEASRQQVSVARGGLRPELFARLGADYVDNSHVKEQTIYQATLGLRFNLFDGLASRSRLQQALLAESRERQRLDALRSRSELELRQALNDARVADQRRQVAQAAIAQAEENLRINRDRYQAQVGTATEVLDAQTLLTQTRTDYYRAQFDYQVAVARVRRAAGSL